jgi:transcription elongation factor SPT6
MILSTELGKDPLLRKEIRELFKTQGRISVLPTDKGMSKIDQYHPYYVSRILLTTEIHSSLVFDARISNICTTRA